MEYDPVYGIHKDQQDNADYISQPCSVSSCLLFREIPFFSLTPGFCKDVFFIHDNCLLNCKVYLS